jgi:hypothetical protein
VYSKKVIRLITGLKRSESCRQRFKENIIIMVTSLYVLEGVCLIKKYKGNLKHNFAIYERNTRSKYDLHTQFCNTFLFQKSVINMGDKLYNICLQKLKNWKIVTALEKK